MAATLPGKSTPQLKPKSDPERKKSAVEPEKNSVSVQDADLTNISINARQESRKEKKGKRRTKNIPSQIKPPQSKPSQSKLDSPEEKKNSYGRLILKRMFQFLVLVLVVCFFGLAAFIGISMIIHPKEKITTQLTSILFKKDFKINLTLTPDSNPANIKTTDQAKDKSEESVSPSATDKAVQQGLPESHLEHASPPQKHHEAAQTETAQPEAEQPEAPQIEAGQSNVLPADTRYSVAGQPEGIQSEAAQRDLPGNPEVKESKNLKNRYEIVLQSGKSITADNIVVGNDTVTFMDDSGLVVSLDSSQVKSVNRQ